MGIGAVEILKSLPRRVRSAGAASMGRRLSVWRTIPNAYSVNPVLSGCQEESDEEIADRRLCFFTTRNHHRGGEIASDIESGAAHIQESVYSED